MKKLKDLSTKALFLSIMLPFLYACSNKSDNYPEGYVGFKQSKLLEEHDKELAEYDLSIAIIATSKSKEDRTVLLSTPAPTSGQAAIISLTESQVTIKAGSKSATTVVKVFPNRMTFKQQNVTLSCTPQWKEGTTSRLTILLKQK